MCCVFHVLDQLLHGLIAEIFNPCHLDHDILDQVLYKHFGLFVRGKPGIDLHADHLRELLSHLDLLSLESFDVKFGAIGDLRYLCPQHNLLLCPLKFFLLNPAINRSNLSLKGSLQREDSFVLPLELSPNDRVHGLIPIPHLLAFVLSLLVIHLLLDVELIANVLNGSVSLFLLEEQAVD